jgi:hypothetical protein
LASKGIAAEQRYHYNKWLRYYWDFCHKYAFEPTDKRENGVKQQKRGQVLSCAFRESKLISWPDRYA